MPKIGKFMGINNISDPVDCFDGELQTATNVLVTDGGHLQSIGSGTEVYTGPVVSMFSFAGELIFFSGTTIYRYVEDDLPLEVVSGITQATKMHWMELNGRLYYSNGFESGIINSDFTYEPWGLPTPDKLTVTEIEGTLAPGVYSVSMTYLTPTGEESGASEPVQITVGTGTGNGGIRVTGFPPDPPADTVTKSRLYISSVNGQTFHDGSGMRAIADVTIADTNPPTSYDIITGYPSGVQCLSLGLSGMPAVKFPVHYRGRVYGASGKYLVYSERMNYNYIRWDTGYAPFDEDLTMVVAVENGLWVGTSKEFMFLAVSDPHVDGGFQIKNRASGGVASCATVVDSHLLGMKGVAPGKAAIFAADDAIHVGDSTGNATPATGGRWFIPDISGVGEGVILIDTKTARYAFIVDGSVYYMNLSNQAVTSDSYTYNSFAALGDSHYASTTSGIFLLGEGPTLKTAVVEKFGIDFGSPMEKRITDMYFHLQTGGSIRVTIGDGKSFSSVIMVDTIEVMHGAKVNIPRGLKGRNFSVAFENVANEPFTVKDFEMITEVSRIRHARQT